MERGFYDFKLESIGLQKIVTECLDIFVEQAKLKNIELVAEIADDYNVTADKNMLQSVIRNLISNAIKFTNTGGRVTISAKKAENNQLLISVNDTGIGMTADMRNNLFRIDSNTKRRGTIGEQSTGLGLLLCKEFVEKLGGKIGVESEIEIGSVFSFTIPLAGFSPKQNASETVLSDDIRKRTLKNLNILIAEDDEITAKLISIWVKELSSHVHRAKTGLEAVEICLKNPDIDLVIMDIKMPLMDGNEATRQIRQFNPKLVILAQTTFHMPGDLEKALEAGATDYVIKPFNYKVIMEMLQKYVRN
jgi:CheY-like chemotaxis protein